MTSSTLLRVRVNVPRPGQTAQYGRVALLPTRQRSREPLERLGVRYLAPVPDQPLLSYARLPRGWTLKVRSYRQMQDQQPLWIDLVAIRPGGGEEIMAHLIRRCEPHDFEFSAIAT